MIGKSGEERMKKREKEKIKCHSTESVKVNPSYEHQAFCGIACKSPTRCYFLISKA